MRWGRDLFDYVILDSPGAFTDLVATAIEEADRVLLMSSLERTSLKNTRSTLTLLADERLTLARVDLILNQVHATLVITAADAEALLGRPALIRIDYDEQVGRANAMGVPVVLAYPKARSARQFRQLVGDVVPAHPGTLAEQSRSLLRFPERLAFWRGRSAA